MSTLLLYTYFVLESHSLNGDMYNVSKELPILALWLCNKLEMTFERKKYFWNGIFLFHAG